jgi:hypothetical protein
VSLENEWREYEVDFQQWSSRLNHPCDLLRILEGS